jgi:hypothetical protein
VKRHKETAKQQPLLYIEDVANHIIQKKSMQTTYRTPKKKPESEDHKSSIIQKKPFHLLSLEEKLAFLRDQNVMITSKICKIVTKEGEFIGRIVAFKNELIEVQIPNCTKDLFLNPKKITELHVIGI